MSSSSSFAPYHHCHHPHDSRPGDPAAAQRLLQQEQLWIMLETEADYTVQHIPCRRHSHSRNHHTTTKTRRKEGASLQQQQQRPLELEDWRRKICQWSFRVIDHLRKCVCYLQYRMNEPCWLTDWLVGLCEDHPRQLAIDSLPFVFCVRSRTFGIAKYESIFPKTLVVKDTVLTLADILYLYPCTYLRDREIVAVGMNIFDRFLQRHNQQKLLDGEIVNMYTSDSASTTTTAVVCHCPSCKRLLDSRTYQLAAMTALYLAVKLNGDCGGDCPGNNNTAQGRTNGHSNIAHNKRTFFKLEAFVELSRGQFVPGDICAMEQTMLSVVRWRVHPPTPMIFCSYMLATWMPQYHRPANKLNSGNSSRNINGSGSGSGNSRFDLVLHVIRELARYLTELAVCLGRESAGKPASQVAFCALLTAMELLTESALSLSLRDDFYEKTVAMLQTSGPNAKLIMALQKALWPELLFDDKHCEDSGHPISMARDFGLLDMERIYQGSTPVVVSTPPVSPKRKTLALFPIGAATIGTSIQQSSPVSVTR